MIDLNGRKAWGTGYSKDGKQYGDINWKEKIKEIVTTQEYVIVEGRYGKNNLDFHFNIKGFPFSLVTKDKFLEIYVLLQEETEQIPFKLSREEFDIAAEEC